MSDFKSIEPTPRFSAIRAIIEREASPLFTALGEETVTRLQEIALTPGKVVIEGTTEKLRVRLAREFIASLPEEARADAEELYNKFRRAARGIYERCGRNFIVDDDGTETIASEYISQNAQEQAEALAGLLDS